MCEKCKWLQKVLLITATPSTGRQTPAATTPEQYTGGGDAWTTTTTRAPSTRTNSNKRNDSSKQLSFRSLTNQRKPNMSKTQHPAPPNVASPNTLRFAPTVGFGSVVLCFFNCVLHSLFLLVLFFYRWFAAEQCFETIFDVFWNILQI